MATATHNDGTGVNLGDKVVILAKDNSVIFGTVNAILPNNLVRLDSHGIPLNASNGLPIATAHTNSVNASKIVKL